MPVLVDERVGMPRVAKEHRSQNERQGRVLQDGHHGGEFGIYARLLPRVLLRVLSVPAPLPDLLMKRELLLSVWNARRDRSC